MHQGWVRWTRRRRGLFWSPPASTPSSRAVCSPCRADLKACALCQPWPVTRLPIVL